VEVFWPMVYGLDGLARTRYEELLREAEHQRTVRRAMQAAKRPRPATER